MSEERRKDEERPAAAGSEKPADGQRKTGGDRRGGGRRRSRPPGDKRGQGEQRQPPGNRPQKDNRPQNQRRPEGSQRRPAETGRPASGQADQPRPEEANRPTNPGSRRRRGFRPRRSRGDQAVQSAAPAGEGQPKPTESRKPDAQASRPQAERSQGSGRRRRDRRSGPAERSRPQTEDAQPAAQRKKRPDRSSQNRPKREPGEQPQAGQRTAGAKNRRGVRHTNVNRRSPQRVFSPGREADRDSTDAPTGQTTYVSFLDRFTHRPAPSVPIPTDRGIKARSQGGTFSQNWWARRWIESMEKLVDPARLQRGRSYARSGQVLSLNETRSGIESKVQGSRPQPYRVTIQVTPLTDGQWSLVIDTLAEQALYTAQLLAGEMPADIEDAFRTAGVSLFPDRPGDLFTECSCPDWANPCKHVAATHYILGDRFDDDPFLLFRMRGRSQEQILAELSQRRGGAQDNIEEEVVAEAIETGGQPGEEELLDHFWEPVESLDTFPLTIQPPSIDMPLLTRLGEPAFLPGLSLLNILSPVYQSFTYSALRAAYSEDEPVESNPVLDEDPANGSNGQQNSILTGE